MEHLVSRSRPAPLSRASIRSHRGVGAGGSDAPLACLDASVLSARYHAWRGASGTRYTTSIFPVDEEAADAGLPAFEGVVLIPVARRGGTPYPLDVVAVETDADLHRAVESGLARGVSEWHVHLLADDAGRRRAAVDDLLDRHRPAMTLSA